MRTRLRQGAARGWRALRATTAPVGSRARALVDRTRRRRVRPSVIRSRIRVAVVDRYRPQLSLVSLVIVLTGVVAGVTALAWPGKSGASVTVDRRRVSLPPGATVGDLLRSAHVTPQRGSLYSVVSHRPLSANAADLRVRVDGRPATLTTRVRSGDQVLVDAPGGLEPVTTKYRFSTSPALPDVERALWHPGRSALEVDLVGTVSGEVQSRSIAGPPVPGQPETDKVVALTFDDGPDPQWTPAVLSILAQEHVPATFCLVGIHVQAHPDLVRSELAQNETLCDHTLDHDEHLDRAPSGRVAHEVNAGADAILAATGVQPSFYRPPGGTLSPTVINVAHRRDLRVLYWTVDSEDYLRPAPDVLFHRILAGVRPGAIILMHDGGGDRSHTVAILRPLIDTLRAQGYSFTTPALERPVATPPQGA